MLKEFKGIAGSDYSTRRTSCETTNSFASSITSVGPLSGFMGVTTEEVLLEMNVI